MRRILLFFIIGLIILPVESVAERKKVGLVLSGGGAKGMSHIGVLKVIEEAGIPIDFIVGTSIGTIIGGLYAIGYDAKTIDSIARAQDWNFLLSNASNRKDLFFSQKEETERFIFSLSLNSKAKIRTSGLVNGHNVENLFNELTIGYHDTLSFKNFGIPFSCIVTNIVDHQEMVVDSGILTDAMRSSMSIPGLFVPVIKDSLVYVDGGLVNNFPVDVAKAMGADYVIGVDLQASMMGAERLTTFQGMMGQIVNILCMNKHQENIKLTDVYIRPDIDDFSATSFNTEAIHTLIERGEESAMRNWDKLMDLKEKIGVEANSQVEHPSYTRPDRFFIDKITIKGLPTKDEKWIRRAVRIKEQKETTIENINTSITSLYGTGMFSNVTYRLLDPPQYNLELSFKEQRNNSLNFGFRFDMEEMAGVLLNTTLNQTPFKGSTLSITARLSKSPYIRLDYSIENPFFRRLNLSYMFKYNDYNLYRQGDKTNGITYGYHLGEVSNTGFFFRNFKMQLGLRFEYFDYAPTLYVDEEHILDIQSKGVISYFGSAHLETYDRRYYPTQGMSFKASYSLYTDNFITYNNDAPFGAISADFNGVISLTNRFKMLPAIYGRVLIGSGVPFPYLNYMGGSMGGRYVPHQLAFQGIRNVELFDNSVLVGKLTFRQRMGGKHYLFGGVNYALSHDNFFDIFGEKGIWGGNIGYSYDLRVGPVDLVFSMSDWSKDLVFYFNLGFYF